ncbi:hypothetical protein BJ508DRAFT_419864 [Ascobolus immersus RN42]|uniref:Uncharacterized protein n=1 Tax=Ascobolus immersus RN42 TaxID=1160509 RepID=A0A3N4HAL8_ASCIM|nr:hypothetical protein BJ508DRAFT_419864 [Ascobolus immersus RN42]
MTHTILPTYIPHAGTLETALLDAKLAALASSTSPSPSSASTDELSADVNSTLAETTTLLRSVITELRTRPAKEETPAETPVSSNDDSPAASPTSSDEEAGRKSPHPLIMDDEDIERIVAANLRLLQGLKRKMDEVVELERRLRDHHKALENESAVEDYEVEIEATPPPKPQFSAFPPPTQTQTRTISIQATPRPTATTDDEEEERPVVEWTAAMEEELVRLERSLRSANKKWSDEQEEVLEPLERLKDLKRQHNKRLRRQMSGSKNASNVKISMVNLKKTMSFSRSETNSLYSPKEEEQEGKKVGKLLRVIKRVF